MLTDEQKFHYDTFGFLVFKQAFSPTEMEEVSLLFDDVMTEFRRGKPFPGEKRQMMMSLVEQRIGLSSLLEDDRVFSVVEDLMGPDFVWIAGDGNLYVGDTSWHADLGDRMMGYPVIKVAMYLDPVRADAGCLRIIPGSHRGPLAADCLVALRQHRETPPVYPFGVTGEHVPFFPLESDPGDLVFFSQHLFHSSFGGGTHRRMFTMNFAAKPTTTEHEEFLRGMYENHLSFQKTNEYYSTDRVYKDGFLEGGGPRRQSMVRQLVEWGFR